jgi:hypothetical protein
MPINYIPVDPLALAFGPVRAQAPRQDRSGALAGFEWQESHPEALYVPFTPEFLSWQAREGALAAVETYESLAGGPLRSWAGGVRRLKVKRTLFTYPVGSYDNGSGEIVFYEHEVAGKSTFPGASPQIVAHEIGHAILHAVRDDVFNAPSQEMEAYNEAFGDCLALLTLLHDPSIRAALAAHGLDHKNPVETFGADATDGYARFLNSIGEPPNDASAPRQALNQHRWVFPSSIPERGNPGELTRYPQTFGQVFVGCFYDTLRNMATAAAATTPDALLQVAQGAGQLLIDATRIARPDPRFFQSVGRAMIVADGERNEGANHLAIREAFQAHGISLGSAAMLSPAVELAGAPARAPRSSAAFLESALSRAARTALRTYMRSPTGTRLAAKVLDVAGRSIAQVVRRLPVSLDGLDRRLRGVRTFADSAAFVGIQDQVSAVLGQLPDELALENDVHAFVEGLLGQGRIDFGKAPRKPKKTGAVLPTHAIRTRRGQKELTRIRFACSAAPHRN